MDCLEENTLAALAAGRVSHEERREALAHLDGCAACCAVLAELADPERRPASTLLCQRGDRVGRYVVLDPVGAGAAGVVYAAYDPDLERRVALKLLLSAPSPEAEARLRGEAQALGRLSHEAVVAVHDVGATDGRLFIAMELVDGCSLREWLRRGRRPVGEVLKALLSAGAGLAAAHAAGVLHGDFKPDNVLCGRDGRVQVSDFGLAHLVGERGEDRGDGASPGARAAAGTPAYMAPEQWRGEVTARTDQFAFAVTLYEALYGERPFPGEDVAALREAVLRGTVRPPGGPRPVPRWLRRVLLRALSREAAARYPSMEAMLAALRAGPPLRRPLLGAATALGAAALLLATWHVLATEPLLRCLAEAERPAVVPGRRAQAESWRRTYREGCLATHLFRERSRAVWEGQEACLELGRQEALAVQALLRRGLAAPPLLPREPRRCGPELAGLVRGLPPPVLLRASLAAQLAQARAQAATRPEGPPSPVAAALRQEAQRGGWGALEAEALIAEGSAQPKGTAVATLKRALWAALAARHELAAAEAAVRLTQALSDPAQAEERRRFRAYAEGTLRRIGGDGALEAMLSATAP